MDQSSPNPPNQDRLSLGRASSEDTENGTEVIIFETSPYQNLDAIVEHDGRCVYFYLNGHPQRDGENRYGTRAVWVRNLVRGPLVINREEAATGLPPMLPRTDCVSNEPGACPTADQLKIVWFEEGNGAALIETNPEPQTIAIIPPWSGLDGFHGYAADCAHPTPLCWPLPDNDTLKLRIERATEFWELFTDTSNPFVELQKRILNTYDAEFGKPETTHEYYSIDGGKFPPRGLVRYDVGDETVLLTVGMSLCPQPAIELFVDDPTSYRRIELAARLPKSDPEKIDATIRALGGLASYPWQYWTWLGPGHTVGFEIDGQVKAQIHADGEIKLPAFRGDPVRLMWLRGANET